MWKDEILDRLLFSEGVLDACSRPQSARSEPAGDHWSRPVLLERAAYLRKLARFGEGSASETIREFTGYSMMLMVLLRSGDAMVHQEYAHMLTVLDGHAMLVTGGTLERAKRNSAGEARGVAINGGESRELRAGDLVHVPAAIPYQLVLAGDKTLSCLVVRIKEVDQA
jgi:mannose-6-phosphate isomerase-like protein (cupin superfamily)